MSNTIKVSACTFADWRVGPEVPRASRPVPFHCSPKSLPPSSALDSVGLETCFDLWLGELLPFFLGSFGGGFFRLSIYMPTRASAPLVQGEEFSLFCNPLQ